jgi:hypothetical protein
MVYRFEEDPTNLQEKVVLGCWFMVVAVNEEMDSLYWFMVVAVKDEMDSLESNKTWLLVDLPHDCQMNGCKWFLEKKKI